MAIKSEEARERARLRDLERNKCPIRRKKRMDSTFKRFYGITLEDYNKMSEIQNHVCAICKCAETAVDKRTGLPRRLAVDHCHQSGKVRGLLCSACNLMLGHAKDNAEVLKAAAEYLVVPFFQQ